MYGNFAQGGTSEAEPKWSEARVHVIVLFHDFTSSVKIGDESLGILILSFSVV